ncbi:MAG: phosphate acyltransferase PlsX [Myxococcales bacterium]|nr:phosphate acyltransferase PlsX [Myxococcales bacterium]
MTSTSTSKIALDAMGGDRAPAVEVEGAVAAAREGGVEVLLVGKRDGIERELRRCGVTVRDGRAVELPLHVVHAGEVITMDDAPAQAVRRKRDASMRVAADLVARGEASALVSAGNSGAMVACGLFVLRRLKGVDRPGILTTFPTRTGEAVLIDMGANVECKPLHLCQYAVMGACYSKNVVGTWRPRVGLLANASEVHKGTELTRETHRALSAATNLGFHYAGYIEGRDVFSGKVDVVVCDGFSGNLVLKISEGVAETMIAIVKDVVTSTTLGKILALPLLPTLRKLKRRVDYAEWGGAPLLGLRGAAIICHGGSNAKAIKNALLGAERFASRDLIGSLQRALADHEALFETARAEGPRLTREGDEVAATSAPA